MRAIPTQCDVLQPDARYTAELEFETPVSISAFVLRNPRFVGRKLINMSDSLKSTRW